MTAMLLGLLFGIQHATDPDHVIAVATIVSRTRRFGSGALLGAFWGVGHTATVATVGVAIIVLDLTVSTTLGVSLELAVAAMLMLLGVLRIVSVFRDTDAVPLEHLTAPHPHHGAGLHTHPHNHDDVVHRHPHVHPPARLLRALRTVGPAQALQSVLVGLVHGLAGSAAVALLVLSTIRSAAAAVGYLLLFGMGTILGMTVITALLSAPFTVRGPAFARWRRALALGTGLMSLGFGVYLALHIGFVSGLFLNHPVWDPR